MNKDNAMGFGVGILAGAVIGGVVALLFAPKTGKETRQLIKDKSTDVVDAVKEKAGEVIEGVREYTSEANRRGQAVGKAIRG